MSAPRARAYLAAALLLAAGALLAASCSVSLGFGVGASRHVGHHAHVGGGVGVAVPLTTGLEKLAERLFAGAETRLPAGKGGRGAIKVCEPNWHICSRGCHGS